MPPTTTTLDRFLAAVHRRHVVLRLFERAGLCVLAACAVCAVLIPLLLWQGRPAVAPALWALGMGCVAGVLWGVVRRPGPLEAAMEADRQLRLADLLGTALALRRRPAPPEPWGASVLATAEARCRDLSPSSVILHQLGARAWGGIGLATTLVVAVAFLASSPSDTQAARTADGRAEAQVPTREAPPDVDRPLVAASSGSAHRPVRQGPGTDAGPDRQTSPANAQDQGSSPEVGRPEESPEGGASGGDSTGGASGSSTTGRRRRPPETPPTAPPTPGTAAVGANDPAASPAGGAGRAGSPPSHPSATASAGGTSSGAAPGASPATADWGAAGFDSGARRAREALDAGQVPAAYREIVRKYFERP